MSDLMFNSDGRVFVAIGNSGCGSPLTYRSQMKISGLQKSYGDAEPVYLPDPNVPGKFVEVAAIQSQESRWSATLTGMKTMLTKSPIMDLLQRKDCTISIHVHYGRCSNPSDPSRYDMAIIFEDVRISEYSTTDLVALNQGEKAVVQETVNFTARDVYEVYRPVFYDIDNEVFGASAPVATYSQMSSVLYLENNCADGDCPSGCDTIVAIGGVSASGGGASYTYSGLVIKSIDGGNTWESIAFTDFNSTGPAPWISAYGIESDGEFLYVTTETRLIKQPIDLSLPTLYVKDIPISHSDTYLHSGKLFIAASGGKILVFDTATSFQSEIVVPGGTVQDFYAIHGVDKDNLIAGGGSGMFTVYRNGKLTEYPVTDVGGDASTVDITAVWMIDSTHWIVGNASGTVTCGRFTTGNTVDNSVQWTVSAELGGCIRQIKFYSSSIGYLIVGYPASIWRTIDGGASWSRIDDLYSQIQEGFQLTDIAVCSYDPMKFSVSGWFDSGLSIVDCGYQQHVSKVSNPPLYPVVLVGG